jgi:DNA-binding IscR family transcriptional regulator
VWKEAGEKITEYFDSVTIGSLCERAQDMGIKKEMKHPLDYSI